MAKYLFLLHFVFDDITLYNICMLHFWDLKRNIFEQSIVTCPDFFYPASHFLSIGGNAVYVNTHSSRVQDTGSLPEWYSKTLTDYKI